MYTKNVLHLTGHEEDKDKIRSSKIELAYLDMNDTGCLLTYRHMYYIHNMRIYMMDDFEYNSNESLLSIHGFTLTNEPSKGTFADMEIHDYLNCIYNNNTS